MNFHRPCFFCACLLLAAAPALAASKPAAGVSPPRPAAAGAGMGIVAVAGDEAITSYDLVNRMKFVMATTNLSNTPEVAERIRPQVLRALIDERLQLQEAKRQDIKIDDDEIKQAVAAIEQQRGLPSGAIVEMLRRNALPADTFTDQVRAQLSWNRLMGKKFMARIKVSEEEIEAARKKMAAASVKQEYQIAVIVLPLSKGQKPADVKRAADKLAGEIRAGASFEEVSRQLSSGSGHAAKIPTFWVRPEQLDPLIARALAGAKAGSIVGPVPGNDGLSLIKVYDTRAVGDAPAAAYEVQLKDIALTLKDGAPQQEADALLSIAREVAKNPGTCSQESVANIDNLRDLDIAVSFKHAMEDDLPAGIRAITESLKEGDISPPFASDDGIHLYMVCERKATDVRLAGREQVVAALKQQKIGLEAQKYMRNLRRDAFVEIR